MQNDNASLTMIQRQVNDLQSGLPAYTYTAPGGWDIKDNVVWDRSNIYNPAHLFAHCYNNDGLTIQIQAGYTNRFWVNPMGNSGNNYPPRDITEELKTYLQWLRGTTIHFTEATVLSSSQQPGMAGFNSSSVIVNQYGRIRGNYEKDGHHFDEILYGAMTLTHIKQPPDYMGFFSDDITWDITDLFLSCASGNRNPETGVATALSIKSSVKQTQQFYDYEQQTIKLLRQQYNQPRTTTATTTSATPIATPNTTGNDIMKKTYDEINKMYEDTRKKQLIQREKQNEQFSNYIRDLDRYTDGKGTEYELPTGYQSAWVSSLGKILLVDPNSVEREPLDTSYETWTRLSKKKY